MRPYNRNGSGCGRRGRLGHTAQRADVGIGPYEKTESGSVQVFVNLLGLPLC